MVVNNMILSEDKIIKWLMNSGDFNERSASDFVRENFCDVYRNEAIIKFKLKKASDWDFEGYIEISSLKELLDFTDKNKGRIILETSASIGDDLGLNFDGDERPLLKIYDSYVE
jgi:hypothetical protein